VPEELTGAGQIEFMRELAVQKKKERQEELERDEAERKALAAAKLEEVPLCCLLYLPLLYKLFIILNLY
jgi:hypothetical protein